MASKKIAVRARFEEKVSRVDGACWLWTGAVDGSGRYGHFNHPGVFGTRQAHRIAFQLYRGIRPPRHLNVCHRCDNGLCVNPDHLFLGTQKDNVADMIAKGRKVIGNSGKHHNHASGHRNGGAKIRYATVQKMQARYDSGERNIAALSRSFGMSESQTRRIVWRESWANGNG